MAATAAAAWLAVSFAVALPGALSQACLDSNGQGCSETQVEFAEDAVSDLLRVELLQKGLVMQPRRLEQTAAARLVDDDAEVLMQEFIKENRTGRSADTNQENESGPNDSSIAVNVTGAVRVIDSKPDDTEAHVDIDEGPAQDLAREALITDGETASAMTNATADAAPAATVDDASVAAAVASTASTAAERAREQDAAAAEVVVAASETAAASASLAEDEASTATFEDSPAVAEAERSSAVAASRETGSVALHDAKAELVLHDAEAAAPLPSASAPPSVASKPEYLVQADAEVVKAAAEVVARQFPDIFRDAFKDALGAATQKTSEMAASVLDSALNASLAVVYESVRGLPPQCIQLREAMFRRVNATSGTVQESLEQFECGVEDSINSFLNVWAPVEVTLEGLHAAVPAAFRAAGLDDIASGADAALGAGTGLVGLSGAVAASLRGVLNRTRGLSKMARDAAGRELALMDKDIEQFLSTADGFGTAFLQNLTAFADMAADKIGASSGSFASVGQTATAIVEGVSDSAHELGQGIGEAAAITGAEPQHSKGGSHSAAHSTPIGAPVLLAVALTGWLGM